MEVKKARGRYTVNGEEEEGNGSRKKKKIDTECVRVCVLVSLSQDALISSRKGAESKQRRRLLVREERKRQNKK